MQTIRITTRLLKGEVARALEEIYFGKKTGRLTIHFSQGSAGDIEFEITRKEGENELSGMRRD